MKSDEIPITSHEIPIKSREIPIKSHEFSMFSGFLSGPAPTNPRFFAAQAHLLQARRGHDIIPRLGAALLRLSFQVYNM